jgi:hypothetical protein
MSLCLIDWMRSLPLGGRRSYRDEPRCQGSALDELAEASGYPRENRRTQGNSRRTLSAFRSARTDKVSNQWLEYF